jgi:hypothetical protein
MDYFRKLFGGKKGTPSPSYTIACDHCSAVFEIPDRPFAFFTDSIERWINPLGGYCPSCGTFVCSEHSRFVQTSGGGAGSWTCGCKACGTPTLGMYSEITRIKYLTKKIIG